MTRIEYINNLRNYCQNNNITIYEYYQKLAFMLRAGRIYSRTEWERENPFLTKEDIEKLIHNNDRRMPQYFASVMTKVIELNEEKKKKNSLIVPENKSTSLTTIPKKTTHMVPQDKKKISKEDIRDVIIEKHKNLSKKDIKDVIEKELENKKNLSKSEIKNIISQEFDNKKKSFSIPSLKVTITSIGEKISELLNGFAVIKEEKTSKKNLYFHDGKTGNLKGRKVFDSNKLHADTGYYVNFDEYMDKLLVKLAEKYPSANRIGFVNEKGTEESFQQMAEEVFYKLRAAGSIRFGNEFEHASIHSYQDVLNMNIKDSALYAGEKLRTGIYVRRDILQAELKKYQIKVSEKRKEEENKSYVKTK